MTGMGRTVDEPIRDEPSEPHPFDLVPCEHCTHGTVTTTRGRRVVKRQCPHCKGNPGFVLRGNPPGDRYEIALNYCRGTWPFCEVAR